MSITSFIIRVAFLVLPGIIAAKIYQQLTGKIIDKDWKDWSNILLFSLVSYTIYGFFITLIQPGNEQPHKSSVENVQNFQALFNENIPIVWNEIVCSCIIAIIVAYLASLLFYKHKLINKLGKWFKVTNRYGENDVWDYFHNLDDSVQWVTVRDYNHDLCYFGRISIFSESGQERELLMQEVDIYVNSTGKKINTVSMLYISPGIHDLNIEVPDIYQSIDEIGATKDNE